MALKNKKHMSQPVVLVGELQRALVCSPAAHVRGLAILSYRRGDVQPSESDAHGRLVFHDEGLVLELELGTPCKPIEPEPANDSDQGASAQEADLLQRLQHEPESLVLAVKVAEEGSRLVRKLRLDCAANNVELKLHDDGGRATVFFDEVPALLELNAVNINSWLPRQLAQCRRDDEVLARVCAPLAARSLAQPIYVLVNGTARHYVGEQQLRRWLPRLPESDATLRLLIEPTDAPTDAIQQFAVQRDALFALFGRRTTFLEALQSQRNQTVTQV